MGSGQHLHHVQYISFLLVILYSHLDSLTLASLIPVIFYTLSTISTLLSQSLASACLA